MRMQTMWTGRVLYRWRVKPLQFLVDAFVNTFGITRPSAKQERAAGWFIAGMLTVLVVLLTAALWLLRDGLMR